MVVEGATGQYLRSKYQLAFHSWVFRGRDSRCGRERERESKTAVPGGQGCIAAGRTVETGATALLGGLHGQESSGQVVLRHGPWVQVLREGKVRGRER